MHSGDTDLLLLLLAHLLLLAGTHFGIFIWMGFYDIWRHVMWRQDVITSCDIKLKRHDVKWRPLGTSWLYTMWRLDILWQILGKNPILEGSNPKVWQDITRPSINLLKPSKLCSLQCCALARSTCLISFVVSILPHTRISNGIALISRGARVSFGFGFES